MSKCVSMTWREICACPYDEGHLFGSARGARNCGDYRATKGGAWTLLFATLSDAV